MSIIITPNIPLVAAQGATADVVLQPGSVISAKVLQILGSDQVKISIAGQALDVQSQVPLQAGQTLQLQVSQTQDGGIGLAVVSQQGAAAASQSAGNASTVGDSVTLAPGAVTNVAAPAASGTTLVNQLTALETSAVSAAAQTAATQQTSLGTLFANLGVAAGLSSLPPQVQQAVAQVLAQQTGLNTSLTGDDIKQAFQSSGLFLEASLASGSVASSGTVPDLKAALIVLRQVLTTSLGTAPVTAGTSVATTNALASATSSAALQGTTPTEVVVPDGITPTTAEATAQLGTTLGAVVIEQGASSSAQLSQPVTIIAGPETPITASPSIAPSLASGVTATTSSSQIAAAEVASDIVDLGAVNGIISPAATPADAVARAAVSGAALNLLQEVVQGSPLAVGNLSKFAFDNSQTLALLPSLTGARTLGVDDSEFARTNLPPPPLNGALPAAQPVLPATLVSKAPVEATLQHLLTDTDGAIARQTLLQVASLPGQPDAATGRVDPTTPRWNFEIPFATPQGTAMAQFDISRDGGGREAGAAKPVWRARFSLDVEPAGPVHAMISLSGDKTSVRMWAERPATATQLRAGVSQLSQALSRAELQPGDIVVRDGAPVQHVSAPAGHFLDRAL
jgi:Flagellar hook-length control protein FliK